MRLRVPILLLYLNLLIITTSSNTRDTIFTTYIRYSGTNLPHHVHVFFHETTIGPIKLPHQPLFACKYPRNHLFDTLFERNRRYYRESLLLLSGIEPNPGPRKPKFPCGICKKACKNKCIACDDCDQWLHKSCIGITTAEFSALGKSEDTWTCPNCSKPNNSSIIYTVPNEPPTPYTINLSTNPTLFDSISDISQSTRASTSSELTDFPSFISCTTPDKQNNFQTSSPKPEANCTTKKKKNVKNIRILNINFQSLRRKGQLLEAIIEDTDPDIIIGTETWLDSDVKSSEILPPQLMYDIFRRDRPNSPHGGVMIASKKHLQLGNNTTSQYSELISASFTANKKSVTVAAFYRPPNQTTEDYLSTITCEFQELQKQAKKQTS